MTTLDGVRQGRAGTAAGAASGTAPVAAVGAVLAVVAMAALWAAFFWNAYFWYDEVQSITITQRPFLAAVFSNVLFEPHVSIYYLLLHFWQLAFRSTLGILSLSLLLAVATALVLHGYLRARLGPVPALAGTLTFALQPLTLYWTGEARMYTYIMLASVLVFVANARYFEQPRARFALSSLVVSGLLLAYSHALGIVFLGCIEAAFFLVSLRDPALKRWLLAVVPTGVLALPGAAFSAAHNLKHPLVPTFDDLLHGLSIFTFGPGTSALWTSALGTVLFVLVLAALWWTGRAAPAGERQHGWPFLVGLLVGPIVLCFVLSHTVMAVWIDIRTFSFLVPVWAIAVAVLTDAWLRRRDGAALGVLALVIAGTAAGVVFLGLNHAREDDWPRIAEAFQAGRQPGDTVVVNNDRERWSIEYYLSDGHWQDGYAIDWGHVREMARDRHDIVHRLVAMMDETDRLRSQREGTGVMTLGDLERLGRPAGRVWYATESWNCGTPVPAALGNPQADIPVHGMCLRVYGAPGQPAPAGAQGTAP